MNLTRKLPQLIDWLWLFALSAYMLAGVVAVPFHGDESTLIYMGRDTYYHLQGNLSLVTYSENPDAVNESGATQQDLRLLNGTVMKYLFGFTAWASGYSIDEMNDQWVWGWDWDTNQANGHIPTDDLLFRARAVSAIMTIGAIITLYILTRTISNRLAALIAVTYFVLNPAVLMNGRRAMQEGGMLFTGLLVVLVAVWLYRHRNWWQVMLLGVICGVAVATKHTNAVTVAGVLAALTITGVWRKPSRTIIRHTAQVIVAGLLSLIVFYTLNPAWWGDPINRAMTVLELRSDLLTGQVDTFGGYANLGEQVSGFISEALFVPPMYSETKPFLAYIADQITAYETALLNGYGGLTILPALIIASGVLIGVWALIRDASLRARIIIASWAIATVVLTLWLTPIDWQRYYLPIYPVIGLLFGLGITYLIPRKTPTA